jgi:hypothetical protein
MRASGGSPVFWSSWLPGAGAAASDGGEVGLNRPWGWRFELVDDEGFDATLLAVARLVPMAALCSVDVLDLVVHSWLQQGMVVGGLRRAWWWLMGG